MTDPSHLSIPVGILAQKAADEAFANCFYCGVVWLQKRKKPLGLDARIIGKFDIGTREFFPFNEPNIRDKNTSRYWEDHEEKRRKRRERSHKPSFGRSR